MRLFTMDDGVFQLEGMAALALALASMACGLMGAVIPAGGGTIWLALGVVLAMGQFPASGFDRGHYDPMQDDTRPLAVRILKWVQLAAAIGVLVAVAVARGGNPSTAGRLWPWLLLADLAVLAMVLLVAHRTSGLRAMFRGDR